MPRLERLKTVAAAKRGRRDKGWDIANVPSIIRS
jgi:hypothetical protein